jgi:hypothetical protein
MAKKAPPLVVETVEDETNYVYTALIVYKKKQYLTVINDINDEEILAYVLDNATAENIDLRWFLSVANLWYYKNSHRYPLSFELARLGQFNKTSSMLKTMNIDYVSRIVGRVFQYRMDTKPKIRRKRIQAIPENIEIILKR